MTDALIEQILSSLRDQYAIERELGGGGMARVFVATELSLQRRVVIKLLSPDLAQDLSSDRFQREITFAAQLQHPHIVPLLRAGVTERGTPYYTMPFVEGESLRRRLDEGPPLSIADITDMLRDVAKALAYAHRHDVVHRDIKPENVLLTDGAASVTDFGIAKAIRASRMHDAAGTITAAGSSLGTPAYMAPEQAAGGVAGTSGDVYAWGVMAYELLAGEHPFETKTTAQQLIIAHLSEQPLPLRERSPKVPVALAALVMHCLEKDPAQRPRDGAELLLTLESVRTGALHARHRLPGRSLRRFAIVSVACFAVLVLGVITWRRSHPREIDAQVIAVVPFRVAGADASLRYLREGMLDLLTAKLSQGSSVRAVDSRTLLNAWRKAGGTDVVDPDQAASLRMASSVGAGQLLEGEVVGNAGRLTFSATLIDVVSGITRARATSEGSTDSLTALVDQLTAQLLSLRAGETEQTLTQLARTPLAPLRDYLDGQRLYRAGQYHDAALRYADALAKDSNFVLAAIAFLRTSEWLGATAFHERASRVAWRLRPQLSARDQAVIDGYLGSHYPTPPTAAERILATARDLELAPDSPEKADLLGDSYYHFGHMAGIADAPLRAREFVLRSIALDSTYLPPYEHLADILYRTADTGTIQKLIRSWPLTDSTRNLVPALRLIDAAMRHDEPAVRSIKAGMKDWPEVSLIAILMLDQSFAVLCENCFHDAAAARTMRAPTDRKGNALSDVAVIDLNEGRPAHAAQLFAQARTMGGGPDSIRSGVIAVLTAIYWDAAPPAAASVQALLNKGESLGTSLGENYAQAIGAVGAASLFYSAQGKVERARRAIESLRQIKIAPDSIEASQFRARVVLLTETQLAEVSHDARLRSLLLQLDSVATTASIQRGTRLDATLPLIAARGWEQIEEPRRALTALRMPMVGIYNQVVFRSTRLRDEARLAASLGEREAAIAAYRTYLATRRSPEPSLHGEVDAVRREYERLAASAR